MTRVDVSNLATGDVQSYVGCSPRDAVIAAWEQDRGNWNTWEYAKSKAPIVFGKLFVTAGNWSARR